jgi:hypothetical protein
VPFFSGVETEFHFAVVDALSRLVFNLGLFLTSKELGSALPFIPPTLGLPSGFPEEEGHSNPTTKIVEATSRARACQKLSPPCLELAG